MAAIRREQHKPGYAGSGKPGRPSVRRRPFLCQGCVRPEDDVLGIFSTSREVHCERCHAPILHGHVVELPKPMPVRVSKKARAAPAEGTDVV